MEVIPLNKGGFLVVDGCVLNLDCADGCLTRECMKSTELCPSNG